MSTSTEIPADSQESVFEVARRHGLEVTRLLNIEEVGLDFRVITAVDRAGLTWVLRQPRRPDMLDRIQREARALAYLGPRVPFAVPDWRVATNELVAYPRLPDRTAIQVDSPTGELKWNIDRSSDVYVASLGRSLAALHRLSTEEAADAGLRSHTAAEMRASVAAAIDAVTREFEVAPVLKRRWEEWLQDVHQWPKEMTVVHGDLYAGHILVDEGDQITGMIDWSETEIGDPSVDFTSHLLLFGEASLEKVIDCYRDAGGRTWTEMVPQINERLAATPLKYAQFALETKDPMHLESARLQLLEP